MIQKYRFGLGFVILTQLLMIHRVFLQTVPITDGWYLAAAKHAETYIPYRDFYFPFPIGTLWLEGSVPNLFSNPLIAAQIIHSFAWLVFSTALYFILRFIASEFSASLASAICLTAYFVQPGNIISGYLELMYMFIFLGIALTLWSIRKSSATGNFYMYLAGVAFSFSVIIKQTAIIPVLAIFVCYLFLGSHLKLFQGRYTYLILGIFSIAIPVISWLQSAGSLIPMIKILAGGGGKNPGGLSVVTTIGNNLIPANSIPVIVITVVFCTISVNKFTRSINSLLASVVFLSLSGFHIFSFQNTNVVSGYFFFTISILAFVVYARSQSVDKKDPPSTEFGDLLGLSLCIGAIFLGSSLAESSIRSPLKFNPLIAFSDFGIFITSNLNASFLITFFLAINFFLNSDRKTETSVQRDYTLFWGLLLTYSVAFFFSNSLAGGPSIELFCLQLGVTISIVLEKCRTLLTRQNFILVVYPVLCFWFLAFASVQVAKPYSWYGVVIPALSSERHQTSVPRLNSFKLDNRSALDFSSIYEGIQRGISKSGQDGSIFYGARNIGLSSIFDTDIYKTQCLILWWDVCPEESAAADYQKIIKDPPPLIVWTFETEATIQANEAGWRDGKISAVRRIQSWLLEGIKSGKYLDLGHTFVDPAMRDLDPTMSTSPVVVTRVLLLSSIK